MLHSSVEYLDLQVEPCDICGHVGFPETIVTCSKCNVNSEHVYCMRNNVTKIPEDWICEPCKSQDVITLPCNKVNQDTGSQGFNRKRAIPKGKVKFLHEDEVIKLSSGNFSSKHIPANSTMLMTPKISVGSKNVVSKISSPSLTLKSNPCISPPMLVGKLPRDGRVSKKPMNNQHTSCTLSKGPSKECVGENHEQPMGGVIPDKKVKTRGPQKQKPTEGAPSEALSARKSSPIVSSGGIFCAESADAEHNQSLVETSDLLSIRNFNLLHKFLPSSIPVWKGQFQIFQAAAPGTFYDVFEAQPACIVSTKAYKFSCQMPSVLQLESLPALNALTEIFKGDSPTLQDIALYFFPSEHTERSEKLLNSLLGFMNDEKSMLRCFIDGVELMVFTSNQLDMDSRAVKSGCFLWGVFRPNKNDKPIVRVADVEPLDMDIDMIGGKDVVGRVDHVRIRKDKLDVPPGFEAHARKSSCKTVAVKEEIPVLDAAR